MKPFTGQAPQAWDRHRAGASRDPPGARFGGFPFAQALFDLGFALRLALGFQLRLVLEVACVLRIELGGLRVGAHLREDLVGRGPTVSPLHLELLGVEAFGVDADHEHARERLGDHHAVLGDRAVRVVLRVEESPQVRFEVHGHSFGFPRSPSFCV
jgi:hypothetical protein